jgi:hypothetical protein
MTPLSERMEYFSTELRRPRPFGVGDELAAKDRGTYLVMGKIEEINSEGDNNG